MFPSEKKLAPNSSTACRQGERLSCTSLCRLFGVSKQAYYKHKEDYLYKIVHHRFISEYVCSVRIDSPGIGAEKLWYMYKSYFGADYSIVRDAFMNVLRKENLLIRKSCRGTCTTDSRHGLPVYPNLVKDLLVTHPNRVWVSDITYIRFKDGSFCFLSLVTDTYTHEIVGHFVVPTLEAIHTITALQMACKRLEKGNHNLIHHSDRGVQYASFDYIRELKGWNISTSMTENGNPKENAIAERVNGILKTEFLNHYEFEDITDVRKKVKQAIAVYNNRRPHRSLDMNIPVEAAK